MSLNEKVTSSNDNSQENQNNIPADGNKLEKTITEIEPKKDKRIVDSLKKIDKKTATSIAVFFVFVLLIGVFIGRLSNPKGKLDR